MNIYKGKNKIVASIEARMDSSRLPGKVLHEVCDIPALAHMIRRLKRSSFIDEIIIATTVKPNDIKICELAQKEGVKYYQGSEVDVLARVVETHQKCETDIIVELSGDCPLIDPYWVDRTIEKFLSKEWDFVSNCIPMTFPRGLDCKVFYYYDLKWMMDNINDGAVREHVSLYFYEEEGRYNIGTIEAPEWLRFPDYRWTLDTKEDFELIKTIFEELYPKNNFFASRDIMRFINERPEIIDINKSISQKPIREQN